MTVGAVKTTSEQNGEVNVSERYYQKQNSVFASQCEMYDDTIHIPVETICARSRLKLVLCFVSVNLLVGCN